VTQYIVENPLNGERECVGDLAGYANWPVLATLEDELPEFHDIVDGQIVPILADYQAQKRAAVNNLKNQKQNGEAPTPFGAVDNDDSSKIKINGAVTMAMLAVQQSAAFSVDWTMADNSVVTLDAPSMMLMGEAAGQYVAAIHERARVLKEQIEAATTMAELDAIDIEAGWPT
jgi:hypothetical protein